ncbi:hypothetical protein JCM5350_006922 [Sporobolomyces pararoseus]
MAARFYEEYESLTPPHSSPPFPSTRIVQFPLSSNNSIQLPLTPPPSLPTSSPGSPEYQNKQLQDPASSNSVGGGGRGSFKMTPISSKSDSTKRRSKKEGKIRSAFTDHVEVSALPEGYGDRESAPILPKTRISFPSVFSDDSADELRGMTRKEKKNKKTPRRRVVSQETVITTTTSTRKLEKRKIRYSTSILDELNDEPLRQLRASNKVSPSRDSRSKSPIPSDFRSRAVNPSQRNSSPRPSLQRRQSTASPRRSISRQRSRITSQSPSSSSPFSSRSSRRRKSSSTSRPPPLSDALILHSDSTSSETPLYSIDDDYPLYYSPAFTDSSIPLFRPVVNLFTFLLVSSFCCLTVSAVLVTSFSLTFYDDCSRRLSGLNRSLRTGRRSIEGGIGGVREGMGRVLGNARGAIESAVKAAEGITTTNGESHSGLKSTAMPTVTVTEEGESSGEEEQSIDSEVTVGGKGKGRQSSKTKNGSGGGGGSPRTSAWRCRSSPLRRSFNPFAAFTPASPTSATADQSKSGWATDEDALPYEVPHPTPRSSRPASPHRSPRSYQSSASVPEEGHESSSTPPPSSTSTSSFLPPRPHLAILLPSLLLAVFLTLAKLGYSFWKASKERQAQRAREAKDGNSSSRFSSEEWMYRQHAHAQARRDRTR